MEVQYTQWRRRRVIIVQYIRSTEEREVEREGQKNMCQSQP